MNNYNDTPITFSNITKNRTILESQENTILLTTYFFEKAFDSLHDYIIHNNTECTDDLYIKSLKYESLRFFNNIDNLKKLNEIIDEYRDDKINNKLDKYNDFKFETDDNNEVEIIGGSKHCNCDFCQDFRNIENKWDDWKPINSSELIIKNVILNYK